VPTTILALKGIDSYTNIDKKKATPEQLATA